jgi:hypothetical protein
MGKETDAIGIVHKSRLNHSALAIPSLSLPEIGDSSLGYLVFHFNTGELEWVDWQPYPSLAGYTPGARYYSGDKRSKTPPNHTRIPFSKVNGFSQELRVIPGGLTAKSVALKTNVGALGGVAGDEFALAFGEVPFRLATRTYGRVVAECLSLPQGKYSLVTETPSNRGATFWIWRFSLWPGRRQARVIQPL